MRTISAIIGAVVLVILLVVVWAFFYLGKYQPPATEKVKYEDIAISAPVPQPFTDLYEMRRGTIVLDLAHDNSFSLWETNVLLSRGASRGFAFEHLEKAPPPEEEEKPPEKDEKKSEAQKKQERLEKLKEKLRYANALVTILPQEAFSPEEMELVRKFVTKGGKLLLIGDPTRPSEINSISTEFGLLFETDYLYNLKEYDSNYQNIFITEFAQSDGITRNLTKIALYSAGSISSPGKGIAFTDSNTRSSVIETGGKLSPLALTEESKVLAISDLTFIREPFNAAWDNNQLASNIADWLTTSRRLFDLADFPHFLADAASIGYADPSIIDTAVELKNLLAESGKSAKVGKYADTLTATSDMVFLGFFKEAKEVKNYLDRGKISVKVETKLKEEKQPAPEEKPKDKPTEEKKENVSKEEVTVTKIDIENIGQVYREEGTSILYLSQQDNRDILIVLSDSKKMLQDTVKILRNGEFRNWLVSDNLSIYYAAKPEVKKKEEPAKEEKAPAKP